MEKKRARKTSSSDPLVQNSSTVQGQEHFKSQSTRNFRERRRSSAKEPVVHNQAILSALARRTSTKEEIKRTSLTLEKLGNDELATMAVCKHVSQAKRLSLSPIEMVAVPKTTSDAMVNSVSSEKDAIRHRVSSPFAGSCNKEYSQANVSTDGSSLEIEQAVYRIRRKCNVETGQLRKRTPRSSMSETDQSGTANSQENGPYSVKFQRSNSENLLVNRLNGGSEKVIVPERLLVSKHKQLDLEKHNAYDHKDNDSKNTPNTSNATSNLCVVL